MKHLWEVDHPYYATCGNWFNNDCHQEYANLASFLSDHGASDIDLNLVYRWDWKVDEDDRSHRLEVFFIEQRKAKARSVGVAVTADDEDGVIAYLRPRLAVLKSVWEPLT